MKIRKGPLLRIAAVTMLLLAVAGSFFAWRYFNPPDRFDPQRLVAYYSALRPLPAPVVDDAAVEKAAKAAAAYIRAHNDPATGEFSYIVNLDPTVPVPRDYSILRHLGTVHALGMFDDKFPDPANVDVMRRAIEYMRRCCYQPIQAGTAIGIREPEFVANQKERDVLKLGGAGLALLALTSVERKLPGSVTRDEVQGVAALGRLLQKRDGSFYAVYDPARGGPRLDKPILFYPGEMAMGWVAAFDLYPQAQPFRDALEDARRALESLARRRVRSRSANVDHWDLLATAQLLRVSDQRGIEIPRALLVNNALQICDAILEDARHPQPTAAMEGSLVPRGAVTPTATRLEGLLAALTILPPDHPIVPHVRAAIARGIEFLLRAQVAEGPHAGGFPQVMGPLPVDMRALTPQATEIRIDYVQHSLSALVQYLQRSR